MPSNHTPNYQLSQWEADDRVQRTDFNADNAKIDGAIKAEADARAAAVQAVAVTVPKIAVGSYAGDGAASRLIPLPFTPKAVLVCTRDGRMYFRESVYHAYLYGGLAVTGCDVIDDNKKTILSIQTNGFQVFYEEYTKETNTHPFTNYFNTSYYYLAIG